MLVTEEVIALITAICQNVALKKKLLAFSSVMGKVDFV